MSAPTSRRSRYCNGVDADGRNTYNVLDVDLAPGVSLPDTEIERHFGACGKASIAAIRQRSRYHPADETRKVRTDTIAGLPEGGPRRKSSTPPAAGTPRGQWAGII